MLLISLIVGLVFCQPPPILPYNCSALSDGHGPVYNITKLFTTPRNQTIYQSVAHPSYDVDTFLFNLCGNIPPVSTVSTGDQCPENASLCHLRTNWKLGNPLVTQVDTMASWPMVPVPMIYSAPHLTLTFASIGSGFNRTVEIAFLCNKALNASQAITTVFSYAPQIRIQIESQEGCPLVVPRGPSGPPGTSNPSPEEGMSGFEIFTTVVFVSLIAYFLIGMVYNYTIFGVSTFPEILPNHQVWTGLASTIHNVLKLLWAKISGLSGGYISI